ncbi:Pentatricopeptide repeat [Macleaya cordata]|uniref:Pentatricopeptide repeat n=1 Tax=Macleaya cordata TaxID=56857 RepID=A0A200QZU9_MACCD|nr:Pentatricopeptide repeat [Macleaya cordata]
MINSGNFNDGFIGDRLVGMYARFGGFVNALKLFEEIPNKDLVSWNSMIAVFSRRGNVKECFNIFCRMRSEMGMKPNEVTLISLLPVCANMRALHEGKCIHCYVVKFGFLSEAKVVNSLINMYGKCSSVDAACRMFNDMPSKNLVSWNSIIAVYTQNGIFEEGTNVFNSMRRVGVKPDRATIVTLLQSCAELAAVQQGKAIHGYIVFSGFGSDVPIATALIHVYAKSGSLDASYEVFVEVKYPDRIAWTAILAGYAVHGNGREAIKMFDLMIKNGATPDHVTFTHLLSACSHSGLIEKGKEYFQIMSKVYGVEPDVDHYSCMVDLLGRSGLLEEAHELIQTMPFDPNPGVWGALVGACRVHHNIKLGKEIAEKMFKLDPTDPRNYILLCNMYSAAGLWKDASKVRALMKDRGLRKDPGCSFIEHRGKVYRFVVGDRSHPESEKIYLKLDEVLSKMQRAGYVPNTDLVLHDVDEEVKEDMISKHSEKLAIAFGLLVTSHGMPIMVTKNLRICGDCHTAAKFISLIEKRKIIIRDSKRFHHFFNGLCSCGDYW